MRLRELEVETWRSMRQANFHFLHDSFRRRNLLNILSAIRANVNYRWWISQPYKCSPGHLQVQYSFDQYRVQTDLKIRASELCPGISVSSEISLCKLNVNVEGKGKNPSYRRIISWVPG